LRRALLSLYLCAYSLLLLVCFILSNRIPHGIPRITCHVEAGRPLDVRCCHVYPHSSQRRSDSTNATREHVFCTPLRPCMGFKLRILMYAVVASTLYVIIPSLPAVTMTNSPPMWSVNYFSSSVLSSSSPMRRASPRQPGARESRVEGKAASVEVHLR
jgi:hypothetical protein